MLPIVLDSSLPKEVLRAYAGIYLKEEVQAEGIVRNVGDFARFLETMSFSHGAVINASNISRECQIARKTVDAYLAILEDLLLSFHLDIFRQRAKRALSEHSKFYYFDSGVYSSLRPQSFLDILRATSFLNSDGHHSGPSLNDHSSPILKKYRPPHDPSNLNHSETVKIQESSCAQYQKSEIEGGSLEGLVAQHLKAWTNAQIEHTQLYFWRTASKLEVDFIVYGPKCFLAIEVKNGSTVHPGDLRSLEAFQADYPEATAILLYRGKHRYKERKILCCPVDEYLLHIHPGEPLMNQ